MRSSIPLAAVALVVAIAVGIATGRMAQLEGASTEALDQAALARPTAVEDALARLATAVEGFDARLTRLEESRGAGPGPVLPAPAPREAAPTAGAGPASADASAILAELRALRAEVARLSVGTADASQGQVLARIREDGGEPNWAAWDEVVALWEVDHDEARAAVKLLSAQDVLERFGTPTDVWSNTNGITWQYARGWDTLAEAWDLEVILRVPDGYVTQLAVRQRD